MDLIESAEHFRRWAAKSGALNYTLPEEIDDGDFELSELVSDEFVKSTSDTLVQNRVNLVFVNRLHNRIVVCINRKATKAALEALPRETREGFPISYMKALQPQVRIPASVANPSGFYTQTSAGRYTCGSSISVANEHAAGTLGCLVRNNAGEMLALSNNHVSGGCSYVEPDFPIVAPGVLDISHESIDPFTIGRHGHVSPWVSGSPSNVDVSGNFDAATFLIRDENSVSSMQRGAYDTPTVCLAPQDDMTVVKSGRTTGVTRGKIIGWTQSPIPVSYKVPQFAGQIYFEDVWIVRGENGKPFSAAGDSGSLVIAENVNGRPAAIGLLFAGAGDNSYSLIVPLNKVLGHFGVTLVGGHGV
ncbi:hypothetical protein [Maricaulis sp.]|uniref:hypothetical protein n=1 Tax=Maricaulis sp. TaxID=1486257 RepID=UPI003A92C7EF